MKLALRVALWAALLFVGTLVTGVVFHKTSQGGTGNGLGVFEYSFRYYFLPEFDGDPSISYIEINGDAPKRFMFYGGVSPNYDSVSMKWTLMGGYEGISEGEIDFDLLNWEMSSGKKKQPIDSDGFIQFTLIADNDANRSTFNHVIDVLSDAKYGNLPRPNHHGHRIKRPVTADLRHGATGFSIDYPTLYWFGIWAAALVKWSHQTEPESC